MIIIISRPRDHRPLRGRCPKAGFNLPRREDTGKKENVKTKNQISLQRLQTQNSEIPKRKVMLIHRNAQFGTRQSGAKQVKSKTRQNKTKQSQFPPVKWLMSSLRSPPLG